MALRVRSELERRNTSSLCLTSALPGEGKTFTACNLALALASVAVDQRIVLVDMDLRRPGVARGLGVSSSVGFERVLRAEADLESVIVQTDVRALDLLLVTRPIPDPHRWLAGPGLKQTLDQLTQQYGVVVCDTPAALPCPEIGLVTPHIGACLMVARSGRTPRSALSDLRDLLPRDKIIGTFLNLARRAANERKYGYEQYAVIEARDECV
jgi:Mrp family chromosome partitioning ATPase